jgi:hypothetical protein
MLVRCVDLPAIFELLSPGTEKNPVYMEMEKVLAEAEADRLKEIQDDGIGGNHWPRDHGSQNA